MINWFVKMFVGKNAPALGRAMANWVAGLFLASVLFNSTAGMADVLATTEGAQIDPALAEAFDQVAVPREEVEDGLTVEETVRLLFAFALAWVSRLNSWLRAKNKDWLANAVGFVIGRSIWSLFRFALELVSGAVAFLAINPDATPEALSAMPLAGFGEALILFCLGRLLSAIEDGKRNPTKDKRVAGYIATPSNLPTV